MDLHIQATATGYMNFNCLSTTSFSRIDKVSGNQELDKTVEAELRLITQEFLFQELELIRLFLTPAVFQERKYGTYRASFFKHQGRRQGLHRTRPFSVWRATITITPPR